MRNLLLALGAVGIATFAAMSSNAQQAGVVSSQSPMPTKWQYESIMVQAIDTREANDLGRQGWELVSVAHVPSDPKNTVVMYFKMAVK